MKSHWNGVFQLFQNRESQKPGKFRQTSPENNSSKSSGRHGRGTTQGETPATQPHNRPTASNGNQQCARAATTGTKARQNTTTQKQSKQHRRHTDTRHSQHPRKPGTAHTPTRQRTAHATSAKRPQQPVPHPRSRTRKKNFNRASGVR